MIGSGVDGDLDFDILFLYHDTPSCVSSLALQLIIPEQLLTRDSSRYVVDRQQYTAVVSQHIRLTRYIKSRLQTTFAIIHRTLKV
jgi:hypothetical protein